MANPSVTYTFSNGTTADATQVNQNFTDLINGLTDGTKSLTVDAITAAGAVSFQGNVTLGNGSVDDLTVSASLASSIPIKTNNSFDIGSATLGLAGVYLGAPSSRSTRIRSNQSIAASFTLITPVSAGSAGQKMVTDGSGNLSFANSGFQLDNLGLLVSVSGNALTVALKDASGSDPSASSPVYVTFRSATLTTGTPVTRTATAAVSLTVSSGSTLGTRSGISHCLYVYAIDNAGAIELAISRGGYFDEGGVITTIAEGGAGAADNAGLLYSTSARVNVGVRLIGRIISSQATAGTWASAVTSVAIAPAFEPKKQGLAGSSYFAGTASAQVSRTNTALGAFGTASAWPAPTIESDGIGNWETTDADLPKQTITNLPPGVYVAEFSGGSVDPSTTGVASLAISDGTTTSGYASVSESGTNTMAVSIPVRGTFVYTTAQASVSFELWGASSAGAILVDNSTTISRFEFKLFRFPLQ